MQLLRYRRPVATIFDLLGRKEDDMTYALGYVASRSEAFCKLLIGDLGKASTAVARGSVSLQTLDDGGRTDVEILVPGIFHAVLEAKRGLDLPTEKQLRRYLPRLRKEAAPIQRLVAVTNAPPAFAAAKLPKELDGVTLVHLTWRSIRARARGARPHESNRNKHLLDEFCTYLTGILGMENVRSNLVYVVSLGPGGSWGVNYKQVVAKHRRYFYPTVGHWPPPPNYIAFRYGGRLQAIHYVEGVDVFTNPKELFPEATVDAIEPHYCLRLGPEIAPSREVKNGSKIIRSIRVWCMIDTLLTCSTIAEARDETKRRLGEDSKELPGEGGEEAGDAVA